MRLEFESNVSSVSFAENELAENIVENTSSVQTSELLRDGIKAAQEGNRAGARHLLLRVTETEPHNENAWLWLASISEYPEELVIFLNNVLKVNPENERAQEWMKQTKSLLAKTFVQRGIDASKEERGDFAKQCFYQAAAHDDSNEMAWLWLASVSDSAEEKTVHLNKVLQINPENEDAQTALKSVQQELAKTLFQKAQASADAGDKLAASDLLTEVFQKSPEMEEAWMLKAQLADDSSDKLRYYEKVLDLNSENSRAQDEIKNIHHNQAASLLQNAKSAAFAGDSQTANALLAEVLEKSPEMEEAWLLKSHLAAGFGEKILCYERILEINPAHEAANAGLTSLRAFMPKPEVEKDEYEQMTEKFGEEDDVILEDFHAGATEFSAQEDQAEILFEEIVEESPVAEADDYTAQEVESAENEVEELKAEAQSYQEEPKAETENADDKKEWAIHETETANNAPVQEFAEVKFEDFALETAEPNHAEETAYKFEEAAQEVETAPEETYSFETAHVESYAPQAETFETAHVETYAPQAETFEHQPTQFFEKPADNFHYEEFSFQPAAAEMPVQTEVVETYEMPAQQFSPEIANVETVTFFSNETVESNLQELGYAETFEEEKTLSEEAQTLSPEPNDSYEQPAAESFSEAEEVSVKPHADGFACPFCNVENDLQAFSCSSCHAVLSLTDLEMLLANQNSDAEVIHQAVNRMEGEKASRNLEEYELMFLGIGHINLKNLRQGFTNLQEASHLNPNNVMLASQVNSLAIRLDEIERQEAAHGSTPKGRTILVVDDSPTVRKLISGKLEKSGHEVFCAVDGMDALAKLDEVVPDLILLDITMPRMDGYQVCKMIRGNDVTKDIPVVMISGKDGFFDKVRGRMAGTTGYITKPFGPETLMKALDIYIKPNFEANLDHSITPDSM